MRSIGFPELLIICSILALFGVCVYLLAAALRGKQSRSVQRVLVEKLSASELTELLHTPQGEKLLRALADGGDSPRRSIVSSVQRGIILFVAGIGMIVSVTYTAGPIEALAIGIMLAFLGLGVMVAAFVCHRLSRQAD
jgi:hypothetical protein